jgi:hypothetical protein
MSLQHHKVFFPQQQKLLHQLGRLLHIQLCQEVLLEPVGIKPEGVLDFHVNKSSAGGYAGIIYWIGGLSK